MRAARIDAGVYLGALCRSGHDHEGMGRSLRHKAGHCIVCAKEAYIERMKDPEKSLARKASNKKSKDRNRDAVIQRRREKYFAEHEKSLSYSAKKRKENLDKTRETDKNFKTKLRATQPERVRAYANNYYAKNSIRIRIRNRVSKAIRQQNLEKKFTVAGYGIDVGAIASFLGECPGNLSDWHIDHIRPLSSFDLSDVEQIKIAFSPQNHQWLTAKENMIKAAKYV